MVQIKLVNAECPVSRNPETTTGFKICPENLPQNALLQTDLFNST